MLEECDEGMDVWGLEVKACTALCADLPAVDAVYHTNCHSEFLNRRQCSKVCFLRICEWYEDDLGELQQYLKIFPKWKTICIVHGG